MFNSCKKACLMRMRGLDLESLVSLTHATVQWSLMSLENTPIPLYFCGVLVSIRSIREDLSGN